MPLYQKKPVEARQFDGTTTSAQAIQDWVTENAPDFFRPVLFTELPWKAGQVAEVRLGVGRGRQVIYPEQWLVLEAEGFSVYTPTEFAQVFAPA